MKFFIVLLVAGIAAALPAPQENNAANSTSNGKCDAKRTAQLVGGIQAHLNVQDMELKGIQTLQKLSTFAANGTSRAPPGNTTSNFGLEQQAVVAIQQNGITLREGNQKLAAELNSPARAGLDQLAASQTQEMDMVKALKGTGEGEMRTLEGLAKMVMDSTKLNEMNLVMAESACK
ncbi:uncharacterized protein BDR25DRAFT_227327 [Lindgomyces ingoldianus]|uniref:Uncharacterized protein n=1 Tax=Lindgomyces ingoldianus TaxID=673940 RepID=A0ACB6QS28_9PLEO|nr:uncharacterized protein BDR25DRAFT_227327 [Lindgomyces ingoldianus]KAF2469741.1 hypothetical protein BDR25DRAFT_227327 [Lindgomyces ingoldianus]